MQVGTGKSVLNGIAIGKLKIYKKKDTAISTAPVAYSYPFFIVSIISYVISPLSVNMEFPIQ